jgi:hypothetical protein
MLNISCFIISLYTNHTVSVFLGYCRFVSRICFFKLLLYLNYVPIVNFKAEFLNSADQWCDYGSGRILNLNIFFFLGGGVYKWSFLLLFLWLHVDNTGSRKRNIVDHLARIFIITGTLERVYCKHLAENTRPCTKLKRKIYINLVR